MFSKRYFKSLLTINAFAILLLFCCSFGDVNAIDSTCRAFVLASSKADQNSAIKSNGLIFPIDFGDNINANIQSCRNNECFDELNGRLKTWHVTDKLNGIEWKDHICKGVGKGFDGFIGIELVHHCLDKNREVKSTEMKVMTPGANGMEAYYEKLTC